MRKQSEVPEPLHLGLRQLRAREATVLSSQSTGPRGGIQGPGSLGAAGVSILGVSCVLTADSDPGDTPALAEPQLVALQADGGRMGAGAGGQRRAEAHGNCDRGRSASEHLWELLELAGNTLKGVNCLQPSMIRIRAIKIRI